MGIKRGEESAGGGEGEKIENERGRGGERDHLRVLPRLEGHALRPAPSAPHSRRAAHSSARPPHILQRRRA